MNRPALLVLRALGLGDLLTAVPALRALAAAFPDHERALATTEALAPLAMQTGAIHRVIPARPLESIAWAAPPPDVAVNLHGKGPRSHAALLALSPARLIAFAHEDVPESRGGPEWRADEHEVARWCRLLDESGVPADPSRLDLEPPFGGPLFQAVGATILHPGAASAARRWPVERWATVAAELARRGEKIAITGDPKEIDLAHRIALGAGLPEDTVIAGRTSLVDLARAVAAARRVVCGDTGVAHLASALSTPSVVLFGPTPPAWWGPPASPHHRALWAGEMGDPHADEPSSGLLRIAPHDVIRALDELPGAPSAGGRVRALLRTSAGSRARVARSVLSDTPTPVPLPPGGSPVARREARR